MFPNPGSGSFILHYTGDKAAQLNIEIFNATGSLVKQMPWKVSAGTNVQQVDASTLSTGNYLVRVSGSDGAVSIKTSVQ